MKPTMFLFLSLLFGTTNAYADNPYVDDQEAFTWLKTRIEKAQNDEREIVRVPLVSRSDPWGCSCPLYYLGLNVSSGSDLWVEPLGYHEERNYEDMGNGYEMFPGRVVVAEGYFTGGSEEFDPDADPEDQVIIYHFQVLNTRTFHDDDIDARLYVVLSGGEAKKEIKPFDDGLPWMVIVASLPLTDNGTEKKAKALVTRLNEAGFSGAEYFDSRKAPRLFMGYTVVVAGRYATEEEAKEAQKKAKKKFKDTYTRQGW